MSFQNEKISSKLASKLCRQKFLEIIEKMKEKTVNPLEKNIIDAIINFSAPFDKLKNDTKIKSLVKAIEDTK